MGGGGEVVGGIEGFAEEILGMELVEVSGLCWEPYDAMELMIQFNARHISAPKLGRDFDCVGRFA